MNKVYAVKCYTNNGNWNGSFSNIIAYTDSLSLAMKKGLKYVKERYPDENMKESWSIDNYRINGNPQLSHVAAIHGRYNDYLDVSIFISEIKIDTEEEAEGQIMTKKEIVKLAAKEYVKQYREDIGIYDALKPFGIYIDREGNLEEAYLEHIFNDIAPDLCSALCEFAADGRILMKSNKMSEWETVTDIDRIIDIYFEDIGG